MKHKFTRIFKLIFVGYIFVLPAVIMGMTIKLGLIFFEQQKSSGIFKINMHNNDANDVLYLIDIILGLIGIMVMFVPYIGFGLSTMCVILWRLINGKTGYNTHFKNELNINTPLI